MFTTTRESVMEKATFFLSLLHLLSIGSSHFSEWKRETSGSKGASFRVDGRRHVIDVSRGVHRRRTCVLILIVHKF